MFSCFWFMKRMGDVHICSVFQAVVRVVRENARKKMSPPAKHVSPLQTSTVPSCRLGDQAESIK